MRMAVVERIAALSKATPYPRAVLVVEGGADMAWPWRCERFVPRPGGRRWRNTSAICPAGSGASPGTARSSLAGPERNDGRRNRQAQDETNDRFQRRMPKHLA